METKRDFVARIADLTRELEALEWNDPKRFFVPTLQAMARDSKRWIDNEWKAPNGNTTPIERAIVVLTQDLIVLLGHSAHAEIRHKKIHELAQCAIIAAEADLIEDQAHRDYLLHPESPIHGILDDE